MKTNCRICRRLASERPHRMRGVPSAGMTLVEMTVVILVFLSMITILFIGARAWKSQSDRAICIINLSNVQKGVRSYANLYGLNIGSNVPNLSQQIIGLGRFVETTPQCPAEGSYFFGQTTGADTIPPVGTLYMECSLSGSHDHMPQSIVEW